MIYRMRGKSQFETIRQGILQQQEQLRRDLETLDRLEMTYAAGLKRADTKVTENPVPPSFTPPNTFPKEDLALSNTPSLVSATQASILKRPQVHYWHVRRAYDAIKEDDFKFTRDEQGSLNAISTVLSKLEKRGFLIVIRKKSGREPALYQVKGHSIKEQAQQEATEVAPVFVDGGR
jgi:hypothetical protein